MDGSLSAWTSCPSLARRPRTGQGLYECDTMQKIRRVCELAGILFCVSIITNKYAPRGSKVSPFLLFPPVNHIALFSYWCHGGIPNPTKKSPSRPLRGAISCTARASDMAGSRGTGCPADHFKEYPPFTLLPDAAHIPRHFTTADLAMCRVSTWVSDSLLTASLRT